MKFTLRDKIRFRFGKDDFYEYLDQMKTDLRDQLEADESYHKLNERAIMGDPEAVAYFLNEIEKYMRTRPYAGKIPQAYRSASEALYQEWKGFGPAYHWFTDPKYASSSGMQIIGTRVFFKVGGKYKLTEHRFRNLERVEQLVRSLVTNDERIAISESNPEAELKMDDPLWPGRHIRLAVWKSPLVWDDYTTITARRQIIEHLTLQDQAGSGSIPNEAVLMLEKLAQTFRNIVIAGPVDSGKSTFANTIVGEQLASSKQRLGVVMIEKHPESIIPYVFPEHRIIPVRSEDRDLLDVGVKSLRMDANIIYMTEMRNLEWSFFLWAASKGYDGIIGTYHTKDAQDIPYQAAMSVYKENGGELKGHLMDAIKSCELIFIMDDYQGKKRLNRVSEIIYDETNQTVYANDLMRYTGEKWEYNDSISTSMLQRMEKNNMLATLSFMHELKSLAARSPMKEPKTESVVSRKVLKG